MLGRGIMVRVVAGETKKVQRGTQRVMVHARYGGE
jgi:hypothetical protein